MLVHCLMHIPFEGPARFEEYFSALGWDLERVRLYEGQALPDAREVEFLLVMGGPMSVYEEDKYWFLSQEKALIRELVLREVPVIGVCLGAQLIAAALGAKVYPGPAREIGFFPIRRNEAAKDLFPSLPDEFVAFHWHGDTFDVPDGAVHLFSSQAVKNQGFLFKKALALQFHLEVDRKAVEDLVENCKDDLVDSGEFVQAEKEILGFDGYGELEAVFQGLIRGYLRFLRI